MGTWLQNVATRSVNTLKIFFYEKLSEIRFMAVRKRSDEILRQEERILQQTFWKFTEATFYREKIDFKLMKIFHGKER